MKREVLAERELLEKKIAGLTVPLAFERAAKRAPAVKALNWKEGGQWKSKTFEELRNTVKEAALGFLALGLHPGAFVAILSRNTPEHYIADSAAVHARAAGVSLYTTLAPEQIAYILGHSEAQFIVVENRDFLEKVLKVRESIPSLEKIVLVEGGGEFEGDEMVLSWASLLDEGRRLDAENPGLFDETWRQVKPEDLLTLIYTSGTTGPPKGVMIDHRNVLYVGFALDAVGSRQTGDRLISYLPLAHIAERVSSMYLGPLFEAEIYCCPDFMQLGEYLAEVKPTIFFGVPRVFEKMYAGIQGALAQAPAEQKEMAGWAIDLGRQVVAHEQNGEQVPADLASNYENAQMVLAMMRARLGLDEARYVISGAAPISPEILEFFHAVGIKVLEIYGQSEDTGPTSLNPEQRIKIGTVGPSIPGVEVKLAEDGELLVRGPNVSSGYYKDPELTAETFDSDGWLHSGDICELDEDGYLRVVDRKKEIIITAGGKNIAPSNIENALKQNALIGQAAVIGDRRPYVSALIVLDPDVAGPRTAGDDATRAEIDEWIGEVNRGFSKAEQVKRFTILPIEWTAESGELTPTLKLKRRVIEEKYSHEIDRLYAD